jgi:Na+/H+ antiporter NhaD/arsenite permease-like protein
MNYITAPLIADLFLLAILAIGREEVYDGTVGTDHIYPIDVMVFFISLAYIAISLDASGLIRWLAFKVLQKAGKHGRRLYFYLYAFFFALASFIGNDPIILSGTPFLAYMTRVSENVKHPRAWIHTQFALANIGSAVLVTSNPTNLVLAGAFQIKFIVYTANVIVPVVATTVLLYPFLLYVLFHNDSLIPKAIKLHELPEESKKKEPVNPNIPYSKGIAEEDEEDDTEESQLLQLEEVLNPHLHKWSAGFGAGIMTVTLITILAINAALQNGESVPAFYITLPAAVVTFCRDLYSGWRNRGESRRIAREGREAVERARARKSSLVSQRAKTQDTLARTTSAAEVSEAVAYADSRLDNAQNDSSAEHGSTAFTSEKIPATIPTQEHLSNQVSDPDTSPVTISNTTSSQELDEKGEAAPTVESKRLYNQHEPATLVSVINEQWAWCRETFPTVTTVLRTLPYPLVPFALCMFVLVQALVSKGWVAVFAYGWSHWIDKTSTIGAIGGMAFLSIILCNFAGTNIGTAILLCRVVQAWVEIHKVNQDPISQRTFWATVYSLTIGLNYGAFSTFFSASLAGLLWRDILKRKRIIVKEWDFARVNSPIIAFTTIIACVVLIGEVYVTRKTTPYLQSG